MATFPRWAAALLLVAALCPAAAIEGQSFVGFRAFGLPVEPQGARAIGMGSLGVGLVSEELSATDPTASAWLLIPTVSASMQPTWADFTLGQQTGSSAWTRFPLIALGYPVTSLGGTVTLSLGEFLEQRWVSEVETVTDLGGVNVPLVDRFESEGGSSVARLGWAHRLGDRVAVGVMGGAYVGRLDQSFERTLDSLAVGGNIQPFLESGAWRYSGKTVTVGASYDPSDLIHVAAALEWSSDLEARPQNETRGGVRSFEVPLRFSVGATATLTPRVRLTTSLRRQDWSDASGFDAGVTSSESLSYGVGVEWRAIQGESRSLPVRLGYRNRALPLSLGGDDLSESALTFGFGFNFLETEETRLGWLDVALERGSRTSSPLEEEFWRATFTLGIAGF